MSQGGIYATEEQAIAAAQLPSGSVARGEVCTIDGAKLLAFKAPPRTTDTEGLEVLILEKTATGSVHLWMSSTDLSRPTRKEANDDVENYGEIGAHGTFRVFECK